MRTHKWMPFFPAGLLMMGGMACTHGNRPVHVPQIVPPRLDAAHTPKLALPFSRSEHRSSAACTVQATVKTDGTVRDVSLAQSSGFQSIDEICVKGAKKVLFFPATKDGKPFQSSAQISLIWQLDHWEFRG